MSTTLTACYDCERYYCEEDEIVYKSDYMLTYYVGHGIIKQ